MKWLRESGIETVIKKAAARGTPVFGICGGYQILGTVILDPENTEGGGEIAGMGLLSGTTVFAGNKRQEQVSGKFNEVAGFWECLSGAEFTGYEIHMGRTEQHDSVLTSCGGMFSGNVAGCYVHGIFDDVSDRLIEKLYQIKGINRNGTKIERHAYKEQQYDLLADVVRKSLDMDKIYRILQEGV
jgi:adenosylcobyric acid synthase